MSSTFETGEARQSHIYGLVIHPSVIGIPRQTRDDLAAFNRGILHEYQFHTKQQSEHIGLSKLMMRNTAQDALLRATPNRPTSALILGVGNALDIDLGFLLTNFDKVTLMDIDSTAPSKALRRQPNDLQRKAKLVVADASGICSDIIQLADDAALESENNLTFISNIEQELANIEVTDKAPDLGGTYTFVCSQLLLSQLAGPPLAYINSVALGYGDRFPYGLSVDAADSFEKQLQAEHIAYLKRLVDPMGAVHFADTYYKRVINPFWDDTSDFFSVAHVESEIERHFDIAHEPTSWIWEQVPGEQYYEVRAHSLRPKKAV